ncbi:hypothetical protein [Bacteroides clarus]|jgi:hypothetical protein|uniref:hypothetical protein n=1 Tax=Bacteroides clarus TaxID=626929 RepID=UPI0018ABB4C5|nr:hypothetical protein [Bacteroides clarus]
MGFTTPCFIRKNTPELRKKLGELGYKVSNEAHINDNFLTIDNNEVFGIEEPYTPEECNGYIHCGTNEKLFLAIAALRDDTDKYQWFISPEGVWVYNKDYDSILEVSLKWHKATVNELIEHFKEKE